MAEASAYGFVSGVTTVLVLWLMDVLSGLVWSGPDTRWYIFFIIIVGGLLIALLQHYHDGDNLAQQIAAARNPQEQKIRNAALMALIAIVAVGFGGAVGPEAGILAVITELSALVAYVIARNNATEQRLIGEIGTAGALGGLYGSPAGGAIIAQEHPEAPKWQLYLAGLAGLLGLLMTAKQILPGNPVQISLPEYIPDEGGTDIILSIPSALLGAAVGLSFLLILPRLQRIRAKMGSAFMQTLGMTTLFAILAATLPILRFSGHHELDAMLHWGQEAGMASLLALGFLKVLALALCLSAGWRGGAIFPLLYAGAAAGGSALWLLPQLPVTAALVSGMAAAMTAGMGNPIAAIFIALLLLGPVAIWPLCVGVLMGWGAAKLAPPSSIH